MAVGRGDTPHAVGSRPVVEECPAAAVDLRIQEPRREDASRQIDAVGIGRNVSGINDRDDPRPLDQQGPTVVATLAVEDRTRDAYAYRALDSAPCVGRTIPWRCERNPLKF